MINSRSIMDLHPKVQVMVNAMLEACIKAGFDILITSTYRDAEAQNALYAQQIVSYQKDSQLKAGKIFSDIWTVQKTVDESPNVPDAFGYQTINSVMQTIITSNGLV